MTLSFFTSYDFSIMGMDAWIQADYRYDKEVDIQDGGDLSAANILLESTNSRTREVGLLNASIGIAKNGWEFRVWGRNLTNDEYLITWFPRCSNRAASRAIPISLACGVRASRKLLILMLLNWRRHLPGASAKSFSFDPNGRTPHPLLERCFRSGRGSTPARLASQVDQRQVGFQSLARNKSAAFGVIVGVLPHGLKLGGADALVILQSVISTRHRCQPQPVSVGVRSQAI
ncbi:MAG: hypothetical protein CM15mP74_29070 [Halieaceae bacterium]|nr:MAG: hypothetical protein CM15mP74_29070 [Halieaceae bacterium]